MKIPKIEISRSQLEYIIDEWIFSERDRVILKRKLLDNITQERIAEEMEMSVSQVKRILAKGIGVIVKHLPREEPENELNKSQKGTERDQFVICC